MQGHGGAALEPRAGSELAAAVAGFPLSLSLSMRTAEEVEVVGAGDGPCATLPMADVLHRAGNCGNAIIGYFIVRFPLLCCGIENAKHILQYGVAFGL